MGIDFAQLQLNKVIIHEILRQPLGDSKEDPIFSEIESELEQSHRLFLKNRIVQTIAGSLAYDVEFEPTTESPVPNLVKSLLESDHDFVEHSKAIASHLNQVQPGSSPGGLVLVAIGKLAGRRVVVVVKLEKIEGARMEQIQRLGKPTYGMKHFRDLVLTEKVKVFKIGLFLSRDDRVQFDGRVCDAQLPYVTRREVAQFFLSRFLGCRLKADPQVETKAFFEAAQDFIRKKVESPKRKAVYTNHLVSYLQRNAPHIRPRVFARDYLDKTDQDAFLNHLKELGLVTNYIPKDLSLVEKRLTKLVMQFESGIQVIFPPGEFGRDLKLHDLDDGRSKIEAEGRLRDLKTK